MTGAPAAVDVFISGVGAITPLGVGCDALMDGWIEGRVGILEGFGRCDSFRAADYFSRKDIRNTDRAHQLADVAAREALRQAGWADGSPYEAGRVACVIATNFGGLVSLETALEDHRQHGRAGISPRGFTKSMQSSLATFLTIRHGWTGESLTIGAGCAGGLQAVGLGARLVQAGVADAAVVGGCDTFMTEWAMSTFDVMGALSRTRTCRPFDRRHDGMAPAEGAGVLVLEANQARGTTASCARLAGYAATSDACSPILPDPNAVQLSRSLRAALAAAETSPSEVDYINPHGAGTPIGDRAEVLAIADVFAEEAAGIPVSSTKSAIGHTQAAAGAVELIATVAALDRCLAPATLGLSDVDDGPELRFIKTAPERIDDRAGKGYRAAVTLSFGLGGQNAAAVVHTERNERVVHA